MENKINYKTYYRIFQQSQEAKPLVQSFQIKIGVLK
jgi:hypothetical protein